MLRFLTTRSFTGVVQNIRGFFTRNAAASPSIINTDTTANPSGAIVNPLYGDHAISGIIGTTGAYGGSSVSASASASASAPSFVAATGGGVIGGQGPITRRLTPGMMPGEQSTKTKRPAPQPPAVNGPLINVMGNPTPASYPPPPAFPPPPPPAQSAKPKVATLSRPTTPPPPPPPPAQSAKPKASPPPRPPAPILNRRGSLPALGSGQTSLAAMRDMLSRVTVSPQPGPVPGPTTVTLPMQAGATPVAMLAAELANTLHDAGITGSQAPATPPMPAIALELRSLLNREDNKRSTLPKTDAALLALEVRNMLNDGGTQMFPPYRAQGPSLGPAGEAVRKLAQVEKEKQERERLRRSSLPRYNLGLAGEGVASAARERAASDTAGSQSASGVIFARRQSFLDESRS